MTVKIGINGFGRIGRLVARAILDRYPDDLEFTQNRDPRSIGENEGRTIRKPSFGSLRK